MIYDEKLADVVAEAAKDLPSVRIKYKNYRGETAMRHIVPVRLVYGATEHHPTPQYIIQAWCLDREAFRDFALVDFLGGELDQ